MLLACFPDSPRQIGVAQDLEAALAALLGRRDEEPGLAVHDLKRDASDVAADGRAALPQRLRDGKAEALASGLLNAHARLGLKAFHLDRTDVVEVREDLDVRITVRVRHRSVEEVPALGIFGAIEPTSASWTSGISLRT